MAWACVGSSREVQDYGGRPEAMCYLSMDRSSYWRELGPHGAGLKQVGLPSCSLHLPAEGLRGTVASKGTGKSHLP